jgi:hypothetical protein
MSDKNSKSADLKQKAVHEFQQFVAISLYLAFFFCAVATYKCSCGAIFAIRISTISPA